MSKAEKQLKKWLNNTPTDAPIASVIAFIERYFTGNWRQEGSSHIVIENERFIGHNLAGPAGDFTVPVKGGQKVKGLYLKRLAIMVTFLNELGKEGS